MTSNDHVFIIDNEQSVHRIACEVLEPYGINTTCFTREEDCLKELKSRRCDLLITDLKIPEIDGIELMKKAKHLIPYLPVIIITGNGDIPTAISAIKSGAVDFIEKPLELGIFIQKIKSVLQQNHNIHKINKHLTNMEKEVLKLLIDGNNNREIANLMSRSVRTIEVHRAHIMKKLGADNIIDLVKQASLIGLIEFSNNHAIEDILR